MKLSRGFTIIELMIVMAIITILAVVLIPKGGIAKDKAKNTGKIVDKNTLQGYIEYKWSSILDNCNGDKSLADKMLLRDLASDVEIKNMISPTNKKIKGIYSKIMGGDTSTDNYINVVDSSKDTPMYKDRLYIRDGKVLEGNTVAMSKEEREELKKKQIETIKTLWYSYYNEVNSGVPYYVLMQWVKRLEKDCIKEGIPLYDLDNPTRSGMDYAGVIGSGLSDNYGGSKSGYYGDESKFLYLVSAYGGDYVPKGCIQLETGGEVRISTGANYTPVEELSEQYKRPNWCTM